MQNVSFAIEGRLLVMTVDLDQEIGESSSGKSVLIASTGGGVSVAIPGGEEVKVNVNIYRPVQDGRRNGRHMASH